MKIVDIEEENLHKDLRNFDEIFRKVVTYDNIKSHTPFQIDSSCYFRIKKSENCQQTFHVITKIMVKTKTETKLTLESLDFNY